MNELVQKVLWYRTEVKVQAALCADEVMPWETTGRASSGTPHSKEHSFVSSFPPQSVRDRAGHPQERMHGATLRLMTEQVDPGVTLSQFVTSFPSAFAIESECSKPRLRTNDEATIDHPPY